MSPNEFNAAWDARDRLVEELKRERCLPKRTLYIRRNDGGTFAIGLLPDQGGVVAIDWNNATCNTLILRQPVLRLDPYAQKPEGFGGILGFGEKGARGWKIRLIDGGHVRAEATVLPNITAIADVLGSEDPFLCGKRKPRTAPHGQLRPEDKAICARTLMLWERLVLQNG